MGKLEELEGGKTTEVEREFMTVQQVAELLCLDEKTIYDAVAAGELPGAQRVRRTIRIHRPTVVSWFATGMAPAKKRKSPK